MTHPVLHCLEDGCHQENPVENRFCQACAAPLVHRYLRLLGRSLATSEVQTLIHERYWVVHPQWVLDLHPELPPTMPEVIPDLLLPYLRLIPQRLHLPQVYGQLPEQTEETWLLEYGSTTRQDPQQLTLPRLDQVWSTADAFRQIYWLWQVARLWEPLTTEKVAGSLLQSPLVRVQGTLLQLQELVADAEPVTLQDLGQSWQTLVPTAQETIQPFLTGLVQQLHQGAIAAPQQLITLLEGALGNLQSLRDRTYALVAGTDQGPSRDHNEDACFPEAEQPLTGESLLAIVCDGIGGHEGGEVASGMAIATLQHSLTQLLEQPETPPGQVLPTLEQSILQANAKICTQNDQEGRAERQRMGTTLATTLLTPDALYHAHVGDSRLYWITTQGCYRLTLDDDVAAREVRLGYAFERDSLSFPGGGSLVQALGMGPRIYPNLDRFVIDEDGILLLCSDGLSDRDRVEQYWPSEILPILTEGRDLAVALPRLIEIANTQNGHDNVTVALVQVKVQQRDRPLSPLAAPLVTDLPENNVPRRSNRLWLKTLLILIGLGLTLGLLSYLVFPEWRHQVDRLLGNTDVTAPTPTPTPLPTETPTPQATPTPSPGADPPPLTYEIGELLQLPPDVLLYTEPQGESLPTVSMLVPTAKVLTRITATDQRVWLELQSCTTAAVVTAWLPLEQVQQAATAAGAVDCAVPSENLIE